MERINCCVLALIAFIGNIVQLVFFFNYSLKLKDKNIELERSQDKIQKQETKNNDRIKELEKKNGTEQRQINELKEKIAELERKTK